MEFAHSQDLVQPPCSLGSTKLLGVAGVLMGERRGLLSAMFCHSIQACCLSALRFVCKHRPSLVYSALFVNTVPAFVTMQTPALSLACNAVPADYHCI